MSISEFENLLAAVLPARGPVSVTLTDLPSDDDLLELLDRAIVAGEHHGAPLVEVHAPRDRYALLEGGWRQASVKDSPDVVRLVFDAEEAAVAPSDLLSPPALSVSARAELCAG